MDNSERKKKNIYIEAISNTIMNETNLLATNVGLLREHVFEEQPATSPKTKVYDT